MSADFPTIWTWEGRPIEELSPEELLAALRWSFEELDYVKNAAARRLELNRFLDRQRTPPAKPGVS
jgi:hypothetical protein